MPMNPRLLRPLASDLPLEVEYLVVAGGGGGGTTRGGGGGAGGLLTAAGFEPTVGSSYTVTVGGGGAGGTSTNGSDGTASVFGSFTASGGGGGGSFAVNGRSGGSGGGGGASTTSRPGGAGTSGQGNKGGDNNNSFAFAAAGGGGAGAAGANVASTQPTDGGVGVLSSITGTPTYYAGGGGGSGGADSISIEAGKGGLGGGGDGTDYDQTGGTGGHGTANTGGGGGGAARPGGGTTNGGNGGSGVVILRYPKRYALTVSPSLTYTTQDIGRMRVATFTAGTGFIAWNVPKVSNPEAVDWINAVYAAGSSVNTATAKAVDDFVSGCKSDGIWSAIKACCVLCGPNTLAGALVPLVGTAPTNNNFVAGDYNRLTGLKGDGSTKYLDSNRANDDDPQDDKHISVYRSLAATNDAGLLGSNATTTGHSHIYTGFNNFIFRMNAGTSASQALSVNTGAAFIGASRAAAASFGYRIGGSGYTATVTSETPNGNNIRVFETGGKTDARLAFYSIGESLDLSLLQGRVDSLIAAIGAS